MGGTQEQFAYSAAFDVDATPEQIADVYKRQALPAARWWWNNRFGARQAFIVWRAPFLSAAACAFPVSYTHLDVYKRQAALPTI